MIHWLVTSIPYSQPFVTTNDTAVASGCSTELPNTLGTVPSGINARMLSEPRAAGYDGWLMPFGCLSHDIDILMNGQ